MAAERLQKILARAGIASRRACEELVTAGRVRVNGRIVTELGTKADPTSDRIEVDQKRIVTEPPVYLLLHKPRGVVSTLKDPEGRPTIASLLSDVPMRVYPVGRLDFATSGVLLATNDGAFADGLMHPRKSVPKTYVLKVNGVMSPNDVERWRQGVRLDDGMTLPAKAKMLRVEGDKTWIEITITEGRNQQIRRMGEATGFPVMRLARLSFAGITAEGVRPGQWRLLTRQELLALKQAYGVPQKISLKGMEMVSRELRPRTRPVTEKTTGPRYGGGAPGRRRAEVTRDWGGGAERGTSSEARDEGAPPRRGSSSDRGARGRSDESPRPELGGRHGRTRTTGTSGGIGASSDYRPSRAKTRKR